jgi:hypothetical protein
MKTNIPTLALAALASMFTLASGAPTSADSGLVTFSSSGNLTAQAVNDCGDSSFENRTSSRSSTSLPRLSCVGSLSLLETETPTFAPKLPSRRPR